MDNIVNFNEIQENNYSFSAKLYEKREIKYTNSCKLSEFLISPIQKGKEIGSDAYILDKNYQFIRTSNISNSSSLFNEDSCVGVPEVYFENQNLKKNQILIVKDGNLGNVSFLDKNYPTFMISSGINVLNCINPYYIFAILQNDLFKQNFEYNVTVGSTISHAKDIFLDFDIPLPLQNDGIIFVETIMESIILKERLIKDKIDSLNNFISKILDFKGFNNIENFNPTYEDLVSITRLDSGYYSNKSIFIRKLIESYPEGYFYIPSNNIKGGNTPKVRSEPSYNELDYKWIVPSYINDFGLNVNICSMNFKGRNNINNDTCLIINRTSKKSNGQSGKYVGIASFYDYSFFGNGHHNQGFYRLENYNRSDLIMIVVLLNHPIYREYFGEISVGSKMKEIKKYNLIEIPFPKFNSNIKEQINKLYFNELKWEFNAENESFKEYDMKWSKEAGIYDLYLMIYKEKSFLNQIIQKIYDDEFFELNFSFMD